MLRFQNSTVQDDRRKAAMCDELIAFARSTIDRTRLLQMRDALLARAAVGGSFDGLPPMPPMPPANANALTARHA